MGWTEFKDICGGEEEDENEENLEEDLKEDQFAERREMGEEWSETLNTRK